MRSVTILRALSALLVFCSTVALAAAPSATTTAASAITTTSALLNGTGTPAGEATTGWFRIATSDPGACNDTFGARVPASSGTDLGAGTSAVPYSITATGLVSGTTYYFCSVVENASGKAYGTVLSFTVPAPPLVTTLAATSVTSTGATLQGTGNPIGASTTGWFRHASADPGVCSDSFGTRAPTSGGSSLGGGAVPVAFQQAITGLLPGTTTYFCAIAQNAYGTSFGSVLTVTTDAVAPTVSTSSPTSITSTTATLRSSVNAGGASTNAWFRYDTTSPGACNDTFGSRAPGSGGTVVTGNSTTTVNQPVTGLAPNTTYYACGIAENSKGKVYGSVVSFVTADVPTTTTSSVSSLTNTSATLNGTGNPNGASTTGWFRYSATNPVTCNDTFGSRAPTTGGSSLGSGRSPTSFSQSVTGLSVGATYYYCAIAQNSEGTAFGTVLSFTTIAPPTASTAAATNVTSSTATLNGSGDPNLGSATGWFRYSTSNPGTCSDSFGTRAPTSGGSNLGAGTADVSFSANITSLTPGVTYYACAIVQSSYGTAFGSVVSFTTDPVAPTVSTSSATSLTGTGATLRGSANPGGAPTNGWFRYDTVSPGACNDTFGTRAPTSGTVTVGTGNSSLAFTQAVSTLSPGVTYYVCAIAENAVGKAWGSVVSFTTPQPPAATTTTASSLTTTSATLNGTGTPNLSAGTGWFRYGTTNPGTCSDSFGSRAPGTGGSSLGSGSSPVAYSQSISGLSVDTVYYFCAVVQTAEGTAFGAVGTFRTVGIPTATTSAATGVTSSVANLNGTGTPRGASAIGWFRYSSSNPGTCSDSFGTRAPTSSGAGLGSGLDPVDFTIGVTGLTPGVTYYACAIVQTAYGTAFGSVVSFTTDPIAPTVSTSSATAVSGTGATLRGSSNPGGATTTGWFRYSTTSPGTCNDTFGTRAPTSGTIAVGTGNSSIAFTQPITGLTAGLTYYYCAIAENAVGKAFGSVVSFTTANLPDATTTTVTSLTTTSATLNGTGTPNLSAATGWFRYGTAPVATCSDTYGSRAPASGGSSLGSGTSPVAFSQSISGLSVDTTYYFCAVVQTAEGTSFGDVGTFRTVGLPLATTAAATDFDSTTAMLNGSGTPNGASATGWFRYSSSNPGTCSDSFGTRAPTSSGTSLGAGRDPVDFSRAIIGLTPGVTYYACAIVQTAYGTAFGTVVSFTTDPIAPTVSTSSATAITSTGATLRGTSNPGGATTTGWFRYDTTSPGACNDTFGTRAPTTGTVAVGTGNSTIAFTQDATGLTAGTTYYYCAIAENSVGKTFGSVVSFTTSQPPVAGPISVSSLTTTSATLNGQGTPNLSAATGWFRYGTSNPGTCSDTYGSRAPASGGSSLGSGSSPVAFSQSISGLSIDTTYYFCAVVQTAEGTAFSSVGTFRTVGLPTVDTTAPTGVTSNAANLNGNGTPSGASAIGWFRYSTADPGTCSDSFGTRAPTSSGASIGAGRDPVDFTIGVVNLTPGVTYYACAILQTAYGTAFGDVVSFTTDPIAPTASTSSATAITSTGATLRGSSNPGGAATTGWFRYSTISPGTCNDTFGTRAPAAPATVTVGTGNSTLAFTQATTGLAPSTTYYYCAIAENAVGKAFGSVVSFTTATLPTVVTGAASGLTNTGATLNGQGTPNGASTSGWFRYSPTDPGTCNDTFGSRAPTSGGSSLGSGTSAQSFAQSISNLSVDTVYYYCAIAQSSEGTAFGEVLSFRTLAPPIAATSAATSVAPTTATLNGTAIAKGATTTGWFRYSTSNPGLCSDGFGTRAPTSGGSSVGTGTTPAPFAQNISSLQPGTTYYFCAMASNAYGTSFGDVLSFTTPPNVPTVTTASATNLTSTSATFRATVNPGGAATTLWFRYDPISPGTCNDTYGVRSPTTGGVNAGSGNSSATFGQDTTGLTPGATYYVCAIAENSAGKVWGSPVTVTIPRPPVVVTLAATPVTATTAQLNATANPNGNSTTGWFRWATTDPVTCNDSFGTRAPTTGASTLGGGTAPVGFNQPLSALQPGTTYYFCAIVNNPIGTAFGEVLSFTTPAAAPTVTTLAASGLGPTTATLNAVGNPNGGPTTGWFRYATTNPGACNDTFGTRTPASGGSDLGEGATASPYSATLTGLTFGQTYYFCAIVENLAGKATGSVLSFTTAAVPTVATSPATGVTGTGATLAGTANPNGTDTTGWFRYATANPGTCSDSFGTRAPASGGTALGSGGSALPFTQAITGLSRGTTYYVCAIAESSVGLGTGAVVSFTTPGLPTVTTEPITLLTSTSVTLNGEADPNGASTTGWFRYATSHPGTCNDSFGTRAPASGGDALGAGDAPVAFSEALTGLQPGTTYHACAIAQSAEGTAFGVVVSFATPAAPTVLTRAATGVGPTTATLQGSATPNGDATSGWFRYATTSPGACNDSFGTKTTPWPLGSGSTPMDYADALTGLNTGVTYYFCAIAENSGGKAFGDLLTFSTPSAPSVSTLAASAVRSTSATLEGAADPRGSASTGWFRYSATDPGACNDTFGTRAPGSGGTALGSGSGAVPFDEDLAGLSPSTTYYACAIAESSGGKVFGDVVSFRTSNTPLATTRPITALTGSSVTLHGEGTPRGASSTGWFRYGTSNPGLCNDGFGTRVPASGGTALGTGESAVAYDEDVAGLQPGTTYHACAIVENSEGTAFGAVVSFTTPDAPEVTTLAATAVGPSTATLEGTATPNGAATNGWFRYATSNPGTCTDAFGTATTPVPLGSSGSPMPYDAVLTGLTPATTWYFCAIAENSAGKVYGQVLSFTTPAAPAVTTLAATAVTSTSATLEGIATPNGSDATGWFRYATSNPGACSDAFGTRTPASGGAALGAGTSPVPYDQGLSGLQPATTYWFCALAQNGEGTATGAVLSFTTPSAPAVTTRAATAVARDRATLEGTATPFGAATTGWFRYDTSDPGVCSDAFGTRAPASGGQALGAGTSPVDFNLTVTGLTASTTYWFCAIAENPSGVRFGEVRTFTTPGAPFVTTDAPTAVTSSSATLQGTGNPNLSATTAWFRYGTTNPGACSDSFGTRAPGSGGSDLGAGGAPVAFSQPITGLQPGTTYYVCAIASSAVDVAFGAVRSFTTTSAPTVTTDVATGVSTTEATLQARANPNGQSTTGWFRYGTVSPGACNDSFGTRTPASGGAALGSGTASVPFSQALTGLVPETTYYACAIAQSAGGTSFGQLVSFRTTDAPTVTTVSAAALTSTSALLEGAADPRGVSTTGWFRYGTTDPGDCNDAFGTRAPSSGGDALGAGTSAVPFDETITGLAPGTTYFACAVAGSAAGTSVGEVLSFTTPDAPAVVTLSAASVTSTGALLRGTVDPNLADTGAWFRFSATDPGACDDAFGTRAPQGSELSAGSGDDPVPVEQAVTGLLPATTYYACAIATNAAGTRFGEVRTFTTTPAAPTVVTDAATGVGADTATLNGAGTPNGAATGGWFRYATTDPGTCSDAFGTRVPATGTVALGAGLASVPFSQGLTGLVPGQTVYACALAQNAYGTALGEVVSFTPGAPAPEVVTEEAEDVTGTTATLVGAADPNGTSTTGWFRWGDTDPGACDATFGARLPTAGGVALGSGDGFVDFDQPLDELLPNATYWYCAGADNLGGAAFGEVLSFTTEPVPPVVVTRTADVEEALVTLGGSANPQGSATTGWFRLSQDDPGGCDDAFGTRVPDTGGADLGDGRTSTTFSEEVTDLAPGTWFLCAIAENEAGVEVGEVLTFVVPEVDGPKPDPDDEGSCGCRTAPTPGSAVLVVAGLIGLLRRRRRAA